jgi:hypothetical protein
MALEDFYTGRSISRKIAVTTKLNSVTWLREWTINTKRLPLVGKVSANFCWPHGQRDRSLRPYSRIPRPEPLLFLSSSSSVVLTRLSGPRSRPEKNLVTTGIEPKPLDLYPGTLTTRRERWSIFFYMIYKFSSYLTGKHNTSPFCNQELLPLGHRDRHCSSYK